MILSRAGLHQTLDGFHPADVLFLVMCGAQDHGDHACAGIIHIWDSGSARWKSGIPAAPTRRNDRALEVPYFPVEFLHGWTLSQTVVSPDSATANVFEYSSKIGEFSCVGIRLPIIIKEKHRRVHFDFSFHGNCTHGNIVIVWLVGNNGFNNRILSLPGQFRWQRLVEGFERHPTAPAQIYQPVIWGWRWHYRLCLRPPGLTPL